MGSSWAVKFAVSVLGWLVFLLLIGTLGISLRQEETSGQVALLVSTAVYWMLPTIRLHTFGGVLYGQSVNA